MKIKKVVGISFFCFFSLIYSMDEPPILSLRASGETRVDIPSIKPDPKNKDEKRKSVVPDLDFSGMHNQRNKNSSSESQRTPVTTMENLKKAVSTKALTSRKIIGEGATTRRLMTRSRATPDENASLPVVAPDANTSVQKVPSFLPKSLSVKKVSGRHLLDGDEKMYSQDDLWEKLQHFNPALFAFGQKHNMNLEELEEYAMLMQELDIDPRVITEYVHQNVQQRDMHWFNQGLAYFFGDSKESNANHLHKKYDKIKQRNPEGYKEMVLELMKFAAEETDGLQGRSQIADTHTAVLNGQIAEKDESLMQAKAGNVIQFVALLVSAVFAIYGQIAGPINGSANCTSG